MTNGNNENYKYSWRNEDGNDLEKATKLIKGERSILSIFNVTGISRTSLNNYRIGATDINNAKWEIISKLARVYEADYINKVIGSDTTSFLDFMHSFHFWFNDVYNEQIDLSKTNDANPDDLSVANAIAKLSEMTNSDIYQLAKLYEVYKK